MHIDGKFKVSIPKPVLIVIDDVGWWNGKNGSLVGEPFRTGINRNHCLDDYMALLELAEKLGTRIQIGMTLCEWDRTNALRKIPNATWMGENWRNPNNNLNLLEQTATFLRENKRHLEICLHAIAHEYWSDGVMRRAEWADENGNPRKRRVIESHLDAFDSIMQENHLGDFPVSYIPAAFLHSFGIDDGMADILNDRRVKFISTPFSKMSGDKETPENEFRGVDASFETCLAKDTSHCWSQLVYSTLVDVAVENNKIKFDFSRLRKIDPPFLDRKFIVKIKNPENGEIISLDYSSDVRACDNQLDNQPTTKK
jgi:hypothetical protein